MFRDELNKLRIKVNSVINNLADYIPELKTAIEWAKNRTARLTRLVSDAESDFLATKAEWEMGTRANEYPRPIQEQLSWAKIGRSAGWSAIAIEWGLATQAINRYLTDVWLWQEWSTVVIATLVALLLTLAIAAIFHVVITLAVKFWGNSRRTLWRLVWFFVVPSFVIFLFSIAVFVGLQRLDTDEVQMLGAYIPAAKILALFALMFLGAALWSASGLLFWSRRASSAYEDHLSELHEIEDQRRAWQESLDASLWQNGEAATVAADTAATDNGNSAQGTGNTVSGIRSGIAALLLIVSLAGFAGTACRTSSAGTVVFTTVAVPHPNKVTIVSDGSGIIHKDAYNKAANGLIRSLPEIVATHDIGSVSVFWFAENSWNAQDKGTINIPDFMRPEVVPGNFKDSELAKLRPDAWRQLKEKEDKALEKKTASAQAEHLTEIESALKQLTLAQIVPDTMSDATDLNGSISRFGAGSSDKQEVAIFLTDANQNLGTTEIVAASPTKRNVAIVFIIVPETQNDTASTYNEAKAKLISACPWAVVIPYFHQDIKGAVSEAVAKAKEHDLK